ncbi:MAG: hypothetical protein KKD66_26765 [Proteobacteria bacterium]|nr:hypothetical protein [Pseudomonadota bacterium]MBU1599459.1 hypothetical protein [bacterium]
MLIEAKYWENASADYQNLADLQFRSGEIEKGLFSAQKALELSEKARSDQYIMISKANLMLYHLPKVESAQILKEMRVRL